VADRTSAGSKCGISGCDFMCDRTSAVLCDIKASSMNTGIACTVGATPMFSLPTPSATAATMPAAIASPPLNRRNRRLRCSALSTLRALSCKRCGTG